MKHHLRYTAILLRTIFLLGVLTLVNTPPSTAQPLSLTADMPDAFETRVPVIGDGQYYYIQFYEELVYSPYLCCPFLGEAGNDGATINAMDYMPFAPNRLWTLEEAGNGRFKLKSKRGNYIYLDGSNFKKTSSSTTASTFELIPKTNLRDGLTYYQLRVRDSVNLSREKGNFSNYEWATIISNPNNNAHNYVRFAQLKPNAAHIIYYRQEHGDGLDNSQYRANDPTTRHYLTYSNTGDESPARDGDFYESAVSSRRSIVPSNKSLWTLPTAAAYHQDGLWKLEDAGSEGEFYIKKYEGEEYVNYQPVNTTGYGLSVLGTKNSEFGRYKLERPINNRYTRIENVNKFDNSALAGSMFYNWSGSSAAATQGTAASIDWHVGENVANGVTIAGAATVNYDVYADLTGCTKLVFNGTAGMVLRLIFNRLEEGKVYSNSLYTGNSDSHGGSYIQRLCTIGSDGIGELDVSDLPYVHLNAIKNWSIAGTLSSITLVKPETVLVAANQFYDWDGYGADATPTQQETSSEFHLLMGSQLSQGDVVAGTGIVSYLAYADYTGYTKMILEGTPGTALRVLLNRPISPLQPGETGYDENGGTAVEKTATIGADGKAVVDLSDLSFVHLNAVKIGWGSSGAVTAIKVQKPSTSGNTIYMTHSKGDGWPAMQRNDDAGNHWYAAFYPVEVPVPNKDDFFQVRLGLHNNESKNNINLNHGRNGDVTYSLLPGSTDENIIGATFTTNAAWQNVFQYEGDDKLSVGSHQKLVVRFGSPVEGNWGISGIVYKDGAWKQDWVEIPQGSTIYEMNLNGFTHINDLTVFSTGSVDSNHNRITIAECYFLDGQMINYDGGASTISDANPDVWQLEQIDDYAHFRVKNKATGRYLKPEGEGVTEPNDPTGADIFTNQKFFGDFATPKWFFISPAVKEIPVKHYVRHKESYLKAYADRNVIADQEGLRKQGLATEVDSDWKKFSGDLDGFTQKTNLFEITHYIKKGSSKVIEFPTVLNSKNDHIFFQRFYKYDELDEQMNLDNLKAHVSLDTRDDGDVQYFLYKNGIVTGQKLDWRQYDEDLQTLKAIPEGGMKRNAQRRFNFTNSDGEQFTVAVDVSRYSDLEYLNKTNPLDGDLREPSLTMRYLFHMNDAKTMAANLTACSEGSDNWLEGNKIFHFGRTQVPYTKFKKVGYRGEFIPIRHIFSDYWVYDDHQLIDSTYLSSLNLSSEALNDFLDQHLVSAVNDNNGGKIEVVIDDPNGTGIRYGGYNPNVNLNSEAEDAEGNDADYQGFYFYDLLSPSPKYEYGNSRFIAFRYPANGIVNSDSPAYIKVYLNNGGTRYQIAQFTIYFDANMATRPWTEIKNGTSYANGVNKVKGTSRDPNQLRSKAGKPIAKVTFDYPKKMKISETEVNATYHFPSAGQTRHNGGDRAASDTIANSSPVPLTFDHTNYSFDGDGCNWGSYALVTQKRTQWGNDKIVLPADDEEHGYNIDADPGMQKAFMYIDASEQPGDICAVEFEGEFCANDQLMCTGWISGSNRIRGDTRCPGSITLTVKGEDFSGKTNTIYRFCPGQIYELDNGYELPGATETNVKDSIGNAGIDGNGNKATHVVWQQFYFEFSTDQKYERYWLEVNNNCVSSNGGDFMLDNVEVYTIVPEVIPDINTPLCVKRDDNNNIVYDMQLLKLKVDHSKLLSSAIKQGTTSDTPYLGLVFLDKEKFLTTLKTELGETTVSLSEMAERVETGYYDNEIDGNNVHYQNAFNAALLRSGNNTNIWKSDAPSTNMGAGVMYFKWHKTFATDAVQPTYSFVNAVNKTSAVYRATEDGVDYLILNGNFPQLPWMTNTEYYIVPSNTVITSFDDVYTAFNICSNCSKASVFKIEPPYKILSMDAPDITDDYAFCEGKIPTLLVDLKGYTSAGVEVPLTNLNFDWWLGADNRIATLENYHSETNSAGTVRLDQALYAFRYYYPGVTSVDGIKEQTTEKPYLTREMIYYLQELVNKGQLVLHQKSISIPAQKTSADDPYFYMVVCPIKDDAFTYSQMSSSATYYCDEPQGLRMKVGDKAPGLKCGFVPNENGFSSYDYPTGNLTLSVRLAKNAQFEKVKHGEKTEAPVEPSAANAPGPGVDEGNQRRYLWLPLREAKVQTDESTKVIQKADDYNIYLASTDDPTWDQEIYTAMNDTVSALPVVGKIVQLNAIDKSKEGNSTLTEKDENRLCVYFTNNFEVREGYNYTLSLPFREAPGKNTCDGTILLHLKIVPDYEVWTGAAGNTDWNNDQNWRRADGNTNEPSEITTDGSGLNNNELLVSTDLPSTSGLKNYTTNYQNYRTAKDRLMRKGYAPLYCTHILMKSNEWGNAPVLFDALNGKSALDAAPFPNLSETYEVNTVEYSIAEDAKYTSLSDIGENAFAIVNESESKAFFGSNAQNLGYSSYQTAMQYTNAGFYFKLEPATDVTGVDNPYRLYLQTPGGQNYWIWGSQGYLNTQTTTGNCCFILGLNGRNGQDLTNGAVWTIEESNGKFALKNVGTGLYLKDATPAKYDTPTYFTFCKLQGETVATSSGVRANILKYDIQAREYNIWNETYGSNPDKGRPGDLIAEMYQINSCDEIAFQPTAELMNAHLLNYNNAWMEYQLDQNRWYLLGSALQGTIAGEWYAPTGDAQQNTTYYENVTFGEGYDRFSPAVYQRSWDKAKAVLYEVGSDYNTSDDSQTENLGSSLQGSWSGTSWSTTDADNYLDRLGYKPMTGGKKANVAIKGIWSNTYNDATVDYANGGFSVMVKNDLRGGSNAKPAIIRLPKEDKKYYYYEFGQTGANDGGTETYLINHNNVAGVQSAKGRALNRGRLKTDLLLPVIKDAQQNKIIQKREKAASRYGDVRTYTRVPIKEDSLIAMNNGTFSFNDTIPGGVSNLNYYLVANPFPCGLNMNKFFSDEANPGLAKKYWLLTAEGQHLVQRAEDSNEWITPDGGKYAASDSILPPGQGFFVQATASGTSAIIKFDKEMQAQSRYGVKKGASQSYTIVVGSKKVGETVQEITNTVEVNSYTQDTNKKFPLRAPGTRASEATEEALPLGLVITAQRGDSQSSALVMVSDKASNDFLPTEDTETFLNSDLKQVPTVYTLCGRLATTINSIREFSYLPVGVESASEAPCTLTFRGVETLGDSIAFYDAVERTLTPLESGMQMTVSGQTQNRYYLVRTLSKEEAAEETHLQIFTEGLTAKVISSTSEPIVNVRCYDTAGRLVHAASPQTTEYSFHLPHAGIYIIDAQTDSDRKTKKLMTK